MSVLVANRQKVSGCGTIVLDHNQETLRIVAPKYLAHVILDTRPSRATVGYEVTFLT